MNGKSKKKTILLASFILLVAVGVVLFINQIFPESNVGETVTDNTASQTDDHKAKEAEHDSVSEQIGNEVRYFFVDRLLVGSYDGSSWHSLCNTAGIIGDTDRDPRDTKSFYAKDLLNQDCYYVYDGRKLLGVSKQIIWLTEMYDCFGGFETEASKYLKKYGELYYYQDQNDTDFRIFNLPVKLGDELSNLEIPKYNFDTSFVIDGTVIHDGIVTNSEVDLFASPVTYGVEPIPEGKQALLDLFKKEKMKNTIPNFTQCVRGDFDNDGKDEYLMIANSPRENGLAVIVSNGRTEKLGTFSAVLYQDDSGSVQIVQNIMKTAPETARLLNGKMYMAEEDVQNFHDITLKAVADLNGDGIMEIIVSNEIIHAACVYVFAQNQQGAYTPVMRSDWGQ